MSSIGIKKYRKNVNIGTFRQWIQAKVLVVADFNRKEVKAREGSAEKLLVSIINNYTIGMMVAYWNGKVKASDNTGSSIIPTADKPLLITEGGHRFRWIAEILTNKVAFEGKNLSEIEVTNPDLYDRIMNYSVVIEIATHTSGTVPEDFVKGEYIAINVHACGLTPGENLLASTDKTFVDLSEKLDMAFSNRETKMNALKRDGKLAVYAAIIRGMTGNFDGMKIIKSEDGVTFNLNKEQVDQASELIAAIGRIEEAVYEKYHSNKKTKKILEDAIKLELVGPIVYGLVKSGNVDDAEDKIMSFYDMSLSDEDVWKKNSAMVMMKTGKNGGTRFNEKRYEGGWTALKSIVMPPTESGEYAEVTSVEDS